MPSSWSSRSCASGSRARPWPDWSWTIDRRTGTYATCQPSKECDRSRFWRLKLDIWMFNYYLMLSLNLGHSHSQLAVRWTGSRQVFGGSRCSLARREPWAPSSRRQQHPRSGQQPPCFRYRTICAFSEKLYRGQGPHLFIFLLYFATTGPNLPPPRQELYLGWSQSSGRRCCLTAFPAGALVASVSRAAVRRCSGAQGSTVCRSDQINWITF